MNYFQNNSGSNGVNSMRSGMFVNTIPKSGTHLIQKLLHLCGYIDLPGEIINSRIADNWATQHYDDLIGMDGLFVNDPGFSYAGGSWAGRMPTALFRKKLNRLFAPLTHPYMLCGHHMFTEESAELFKKSHAKMIIIFRDPRSVAVSHAFWVTNAPGSHPLRALYNHLSMADRIRTSFCGVGPSHEVEVALIPLLRRYRNMIYWLNSSKVLSVRFEDIVGELGGGIKENQYKAIEKIMTHIDTKQQDSVETIMDQLFGGTQTFRSGRVDSWKEYADVFATQEIEREVEDINAMIRSHGN